MNQHVIQAIEYTKEIYCQQLCDGLIRHGIYRAMIDGCDANIKFEMYWQARFC